MNILGYLMTFANIQNFGGSGGALQDVSVQVSQLDVLAKEMTHQPQFNPEHFRETGFYRVGNVGKYLSKNLREYLYNGNGDPKDEGLILTLTFTEKKKFQDKEGIDGALTMFLPRGYVAEEDRQAIEKYAMEEALNFGDRLLRDPSLNDNRM